MGYVIFTAGILLIIWGSRRICSKKDDREKDDAAVSEPFEKVFSGDLILKKLNDIESRLDIIEKSVKPEGDKGEIVDNTLYQNLKNNVEKDINSKIAEMKENGFTVDEISEKYGITKGEVLLRAGLKK